MAQVTITINSREYAVACEDGQELRIIQLASLLDEKAKLITGGSTQVNENMLLAMVGLLLADELTESKKNPSVQTAATEESMQRIRELDENTAKQINALAEKLNFLSSEINLL